MVRGEAPVVLEIAGHRFFSTISIRVVGLIVAARSGPYSVLMAEERFALASGGPFYRLTQRSFRDERRVVSLSLVLICFTWLPMILLAALEWMLRRRGIEILRDISVHVRLLVAIPLFLVAERMIERESQRVVARLRMDRLGRRPEALMSALQLAESLSGSWIAEALMLLFAVLTGQAVLRTGLHPGAFAASVLQGTHSLAGHWYAMVALPVFAFLGYRSLWRWLIWCLFLWRLLSTDLRPLPIHPDQSGGLAFLSWPIFAFLVIGVAVNCVVCAAALTRILFEHVEVIRFRDPIIMLIVAETALAFLPLCVFAHRLYRAKRDWLFEHGHLAATLTRTFHEHLVSNPSARSPLESGESSQMIDYTSVFAGLTDMRLVPFAWRDVLRFVVVLALPVVPVVLTALPLKTIVPKLLGLVGGAPL
jgi:hypothetical protein